MRKDCLSNFWNSFVLLIKTFYIPYQSKLIICCEKELAQYTISLVSSYFFRVIHVCFADYFKVEEIILVSVLNC